MKFWKPMLLTAFAFVSISATVLFSACEKDSCTDLTCMNGGACSSGFCHCTTGYEGAECEIRSVDRFLGTYIGVSTCDTAAGILDTVAIAIGSSNTQVEIYRTTTRQTLYGTINITGGQYLIVVPTQTISSNTFETFSISWNARKLSFNTDITENGVSRTDCTFVGNQQ